jgi:hypothetical protein
MLPNLLQSPVVLFDAANHGDSSAEAFSSLPRFAENLAAVPNALRGHPVLDTGRIALLGYSVAAAAVHLESLNRIGRNLAHSVAAADMHQGLRGWAVDGTAPLSLAVVSQCGNTRRRESR